jgi:hypothetical protein
MGAGGGAPPVKGEDVMILIGSSIILVMLIMQTWVDPTAIEEGSGNEFTVKYDLSEGDTFNLDVIDGEVRPSVYTPSDGWIISGNVDSGQKNWEYTAKESGIHSFEILGIEDSDIKYSLSRGVIFDYGLYLIGGLILAFGILKRIDTKQEEPIEAILDD